DMWVVLVDQQGNTANFPKFAKDASIKKIITPSGFYCDLSYTPEVVLKNNGSSDLTSVTIKFKETGATLQSFSWTGTLLPGGEVHVALPAQTTTEGTHDFAAWTENPNAS